MWVLWAAIQILQFFITWINEPSQINTPHYWLFWFSVKYAEFIDPMEENGNCKYSCTFLFLIVQPTRCTIFSDLFYFVIALYTFRTVLPSIIRSLKTVHTASGVCQTDFCWLLASRNEMELQFRFIPTSKQSPESVWHIPDAVCTVLRLLMMDGKTIRNV
jgi:hypothetical protein